MARRKRRGNHIIGTYPLAALMLVTALFVLLGNPFANGRSIIAFGQHYALNVIDAAEEHVDPWTNWETIAQKDLGTTESLATALWNSPGRVRWHVQRNLSRTFRTWARIYLPTGGRMSRSAWVMLITMTTVLLMLVRLGRRRTSDGSVRIFPVVCALCIPPLLSVVVIPPRQHYLVFPAVLLLHMLIRSAYRYGAGQDHGVLHWIPGVAVALLMGFNVGMPIAPNGRPTLATIDALRSLPSTQPLVILEADGGYDAFLPPGTVRIKAQEWKTGFSGPLTDSTVNVIVSSPRLERDHRFLEDPVWQQFLAGGNRRSFSMIAVDGTTTRLFVRRSILDYQP